MTATASAPILAACSASEHVSAVVCAPAWTISVPDTDVRNASATVRRSSRVRRTPSPVVPHAKTPSTPCDWRKAAYGAIAASSIAVPPLARGVTAATMRAGWSRCERRTSRPKDASRCSRRPRSTGRGASGSSRWQGQRMLGGRSGSPLATSSATFPQLSEVIGKSALLAGGALPDELPGVRIGIGRPPPAVTPASATLPQTFGERSGGPPAGPASLAFRALPAIRPTAAARMRNTMATPAMRGRGRLELAFTGLVVCVAVGSLVRSMHREPRARERPSGRWTSAASVVRQGGESDRHPTIHAVASV